MGIIRTVLGDVSPQELKVLLPHEHSIVAYPGADWDHAATCDREKLLREISEELKDASQLYGIGGLVDATPVDRGRDVEFLAELSRRSGLHIVACTGLYKEGQGIPYYWQLRDIDELEEFFLREITEGVMDTGVRCGAIKIATGEDRITPAEERVLRAVARVQRRLGVAITTHTDAEGWAVANVGTKQLDIFEEEGADLSRCIIGHASSCSNLGYLVETLGRGASLGFDTIGMNWAFPDEIIVGLVVALVNMGYANQILLSVDRVPFYKERSSKDPKGDPVDFGFLHREFIPRLFKSGVAEESVIQMTRDNPQRIFAF